VKIKVVLARLSNGRVLILGDTGQSDHDNFEELSEVTQNIIGNDKTLKPVEVIKFEEIEIKNL